MLRACKTCMGASSGFATGPLTPPAFCPLLRNPGSATTRVIYEATTISRYDIISMTKELANNYFCTLFSLMPVVVFNNHSQIKSVDDV